MQSPIESARVSWRLGCFGIGQLGRVDLTVVDGFEFGRWDLADPVADAA